MDSRTRGTLQGAGAGLATGASLGSFAGPYGTVIGAGVGAIGGGLYGYFASEDEEEQRQKAEEEEAQRLARAKHDAWQQYMLGEAAALGAPRAAIARARYDIGLSDLEQRGLEGAAARKAQYKKMDDRADIGAVTGLASSITGAAQKTYNGFKNRPTTDPSTFTAMPTAPPPAGSQPADLSRIPPPTYTPSHIQDPSLSPEQQDLYDAENLRPLRRGFRDGF